MPKTKTSIETPKERHGSVSSSPAYQQNDYLGWIARAKLDATKAEAAKANA